MVPYLFIKPLDVEIMPFLSLENPDSRYAASTE